MAVPATLALIRFRETDVNILPRDEMGSLADLNTDAGLTLPPVVDSFTGKGRSFSNGFALDAVDAVSGATLATRDVTVQAIMSWDLTAQNAYGQTGTIVARGKGNAAAEYVSYSLELRVVNAALGIGELRFWWQDSAGVVKTQIGGQFIAAPGFILFSAVRRWVSPTAVEIRYYAGDRLIGEVLSTDGDIAGGTTGTFCVGTRYSAGAAGKFLVGVIDELRVLNYELTLEEIEATWDRLSRQQPRGYRAIRDLFQPGAPVTDDPSSRFQKLLRIAGQALGFAAAQVENVRKNQLSDRAYGPVLEQWERITKEAPKAGDSVERRRKRVLAHQRQRAGTSVPGVQATVAELVAQAQSQVEVNAFDQTITDSFTTLETQRWDPNPSADWTINANTLRVQAAAATFTYDGGTRLWKTNLMSVGGNGKGLHVLTKLTPTNMPATSEAGIFFGNLVAGNFLLLGLRFDGAWKVVGESFQAWKSQGLQTLEALGGPPANIWLHLQHKIPYGSASGPGPGPATYTPAWSLTSQLAGYTVEADFTHPSSVQWIGHYMRSVGAIAAGFDVKFDDTIVRTRWGERSFQWYVYRDPTLPGAPDYIAAHQAIRRLKHAHVEATVIRTKSALYDDANSGFDREPLGSI